MYLLSQNKPVEKEIRWSKPPKGYRKLNVDASYYPNGSGAAGIVLRYDKGEAIAGKACWLNNMMSAVNAEPTALLRGLEFLEQMGCSSAYVYSHSLELIKTCNGDIELWSPYTAVLTDCF
jgi:ribonuclease HI